MPQLRRGETRREPQRETAIVAALLNHPRLIDAWAEELASLPFESTALSDFLTRLLAVALEAEADAPALAGALERAGLGAERARILGLARNMPIWWCLAEEASMTDVDAVFGQSMTLQRDFRALNRDLKSAFSAFETDPSERNLAHLLDIKQRLADLTGKEAALDGFGAASGRGLTPL